MSHSNALPFKPALDEAMLNLDSGNFSEALEWLKVADSLDESGNRSISKAYVTLLTAALSRVELQIIASGQVSSSHLDDLEIVYKIIFDDAKRLSNRMRACIEMEVASDAEMIHDLNQAAFVLGALLAFNKSLFELARHSSLPIKDVVKIGNLVSNCHSYLTGIKEHFEVSNCKDDCLRAIEKAIGNAKREILTFPFAIATDIEKAKFFIDGAIFLIERICTKNGDYELRRLLISCRKELLAGNTITAERELMLAHEFCMRLGYLPIPELA